MSSPFEIAERYIQLRKKWNPENWVDTIARINEMILTPLICCFFLLLGTIDVFMIASAILNTFNAWREWIEYQELRLIVQRMFLLCMYSGGPFIRTNDDQYLPYVFADAVVRHDMRHLHSAKELPKEERETHIQ
jgi:hypothetical protein